REASMNTIALQRGPRRSGAWGIVVGGHKDQAGRSKGARVFVQVIQGQVSDPEQARAALDRWARELAPGAGGWLGSTARGDEDGPVIAPARLAVEGAGTA